MGTGGGGDWELTLASPSKINLFLRIIRRREDGYHDLASLFQAISLCDTLHFREKEVGSEDQEDSLESDSENVPLDGSNLILKALRVFREQTGTTKRFHVRLEKKIPVQAGLGGGSGNAATALWAANVLNGQHWSNEQLAQFGALLGSDISFFFSGGTAYCTGRGELVKPLEQLPPMSLYIVKPKEGLSTAAVYKALNVNSLSHDNPKELIDKIRGGAYWAKYVNDLEEPSFRLMPSLRDLKTFLINCGFRVVLMSGSGTAFFCLGEPATSLTQMIHEVGSVQVEKLG